jgi:ribulose-phosphate 3-epimerase
MDSRGARTSPARLLADLHAAAPLVAPSLLACDFTCLGEEVRRVEQAGAKLLHLDIMDGHFVPNLSFGLPVVEAVRRSTRLPLEVHLMISEPGRYWRRFREAGADLLTIHIEAVPEPRALLGEIRASGAAVGLSLNPPTPLATLDGCLDLCDLVLVMSVMPGFGGQAFESVALEKLRTLRGANGTAPFSSTQKSGQSRSGPLLSIDGGVNLETAGACAAAGAELLVVGSALFSQKDYGRFLGTMTELATAAEAVQV